MLHWRRSKEGGNSKEQSPDTSPLQTPIFLFCHSYPMDLNPLLFALALVYFQMLSLVVVGFALGLRNVIPFRGNTIMAVAPERQDRQLPRTPPVFSSGRYPDNPLPLRRRMLFRDARCQLVRTKPTICMRELSSRFGHTRVGNA